MDDLKTMHFPGFTLKTPSTWTISFDKNFPASIFVNIDTADKFKVDIGVNSKGIASYQSIKVEDINIEQVVDDESEEKIIAEKKSVITQTLKSDSYLDIIANREVRCLVPEAQGKGVIGVFFTESKSGTDNLLPMSFTAFNLKPHNQTEFLTAIQTLTFDNNKSVDQ